MAVYLSIVGGKIFYADSNPGDLIKQINIYATTGNSRSASVAKCLPNPISHAQMTEQQFIRFKNAGRRHGSHTPNKMIGGLDRTRLPRTSSPALEKWDVGPYGSLTGKAGPWGAGKHTNRDHMTANSSNQLRFNNGNWPGNAVSKNQVKNEGLAIAVSGEHHRKGSYTYGTRVHTPSPITSLSRMQYGERYPQQAFQTEMDQMLEWKRSHTKSPQGPTKNTLRLEMVGAYAYMYKLAVDCGFFDPSTEQDQRLIYWTKLAVESDNAGQGKHGANHPRK
ncbi:hypothetical protein SAMN04487965_3646 [Microbulbifer donghaiensis]|uniref:Uncharacterized protein n=1 Tax=Microbulbifer donghaiensis TaxID=494016 RepID=A0A1M5IDQ5_9GAMM|nr:hypothetical protein [Microbulbifer donghaiensis]SHG26478.1 hypothetical protein SAMN04487965_3646 [Microbulbifer donghaiensis]